MVTKLTLAVIFVTLNYVAAQQIQQSKYTLYMFGLSVYKIKIT